MAIITISLPDEVAKRVDTESKLQGFASRSEFIRSLLRQQFSGGIKLEKFQLKPIDQIKLELARTGKYSEKFIDSITRGLAKSSLYEQD